MALFRTRSQTGLLLTQVTLRPDPSTRSPQDVARWDGVVGRVSGEQFRGGVWWLEVLPGWQHPGQGPLWVPRSEVVPCEQLDVAA